MKIKARELSDKQRMTILDTLYTAAGTVKGREAMKEFLRDVLTESERIMVGRRLLIARHLIGGKTYEDIAETLRVGHDTIRKVDRWLNDQMPGYENALKGLEKELAKRAQRKLYATSALARLKKKYPLHFLLFPTPKAQPLSLDE
jgi:uncharacterized protein YerC